jgi:hypothetical protein
MDVLPVGKSQPPQKLESKAMIKVIALSVLSCAAFATGFFGRLLAVQASAPTGETAENATFKPVAEAPLPEGFPTYTPVGEIEVKHYPAYRKAETTGGGAFWTLFQHIKTAGISMTAPVEMTYQADGPPVGREQAMAFLYGEKNAGTAGRKGTVDVVDVPAATVLSIGMRGGRSDAVLVGAEQRLRNWLAENKTLYEQSGAVRLMGYNSPFVPRDRQFYEVQIPIRELSKSSVN